MENEEKNIVRASKFMSFVLRHKPESIGLELDGNGWASIDELVELSRNGKVRLTEQLIMRVVACNDKQRFSISEDGRRVRANQGHSIQVDLNLIAKNPPPALYHGTATRFLKNIFQRGLLKQNRQHVHLSADLETALRVGQRHGMPVVLEVDAAGMLAQGHVFFQSENGVWLTDAVPVKYLAVIRGRASDV